MKSSPVLTRRATLLASAAILLISGIVEASAQSALELIFNGKDLSGWKAPEPNPYWKVSEGMFVGESEEKLKSNVLRTEKVYRDVIVEAEVRWNGEIDSGIMVRTPEIQVQIGVSRSLKQDMTGSFYVGKYPEAGQAREANRLLKPGDWNAIRLQAKGDTFTVWLNGEKVSEYTDPKYSAPGPIGLQVHGGVKMKVEFRNLRARALE